MITQENSQTKDPHLPLLRNGPLLSRKAGEGLEGACLPLSLRERRGPPPKAVGGEGLAKQSNPRRGLRRGGARIQNPGTAQTQVFSPPVLQPDGSWGKPRSGLKGYSSVGRVAVSKTAGRGFESLCPCQARQIRRTRLFRSVTAGKPAPSRNCPALVARRRRLPDLPALLSGHQRGRDRRPAGDHPEARPYRRPRRGRHLDLALLQIPDERFRL